MLTNENVSLFPKIQALLLGQSSIHDETPQLVGLEGVGATFTSPRAGSEPQNSPPCKAVSRHSERSTVPLLAGAGRGGCIADGTSSASSSRGRSQVKSVKSGTSGRSHPSMSESDYKLKSKPRGGHLAESIAPESDAVSTLVDMGFPRDAAMAAVRDASGDIQAAIELLMLT